MLPRVINHSTLLLGACKSSCNKSSIKLQKNVILNLRLLSSSKKYINTYCPLLRSQQPKEKPKEVNDERDSNNNIDKNIEGVNKHIQPKKIDEEVKKVSKKDVESAKNDSQKENSKEEEQAKKDYSKYFYNKKSNLFETDIMVHNFVNAQNKNKDTFLECLRMYINQPGKKRERTFFIYGALKYMEEFNVHKDLSVYKKLLDIFPKESMIPTNVFQTMFMHYPREQYCATAVLEQMEDNGVMPDSETELILLSIFGRHGMPLEKYWKMMYWMPKFKNLNPWPVPTPIPNDPLELAKLAMYKISSIDYESEISVFNTDDITESIDKTWIVSAMAPKQSELLLKHDKKLAIYVEGPFKIYVATKAVDYFTLRANPPLDRKYPDDDPDAVEKLRNPYLETKTAEIILPPSVHEQEDSTIFANCATGLSSKDSLLSWIRCLEKTNPVLAEIPIVFTLKNYSTEKLYIETSSTTKQIPSSFESNKDTNN